MTSIFVNFADAGAAAGYAALPADGCGPCPIEGILRNQIGVHPMALIYPQRVSDPRERRRMGELTEGYADGAAFFIERLADGLAKFAEAFAPRPAIVRFSDFQSDEYADLLGGRDFEAADPNPMIGFRGAGRYVHEAYADAFALECAAVQRVRVDMGFANLHPMVPYCRRAGEAEAVRSAMAANGLKQGRDGLEIHLLAEVPSNAAEISELAAIFDAISIGSRDLARTVMGVDPSARHVDDDVYDRCGAGVRWFIQAIVTGAKAANCPVSICGPAPSEDRSLVEYVLGLGIDGLSFRPETLHAMVEVVAEWEGREEAK